MSTEQLSLFAGIVSTMLFASSNVPMLVKAFRTRNLQSYSLAYLVINNVGNAFHWAYIFGLPWGPIWILHGFYTVSAAIMLLWYLRHRVAALSARPEARSRPDRRF